MDRTEQVSAATADQVSALVFPGGVWFKGTYYPPIAGGAPDGDDPPASVTPPPTSTPPVVEPPTPEPFDKERALATIGKLREFEKTAKAQAKELEELRATQKAANDAKLSDLEKAQANAQALEMKTAALESQLAQSQAAYQQAIIRTAVEREAHQAGAVKADVVYRLADLSGVALDEAGNVTGAKKAVETLLEAEPYLRAAAPTGTAPTAAIPITPKPNGKPQTEAERVESAYQRLGQSGRYGRL